MGINTLSAATSALTVSMLSAGGQSMRTTSKSLRFGCSACRSLVSRPIGSVSRRTSAAVRSWFAGNRVKPPCSVGSFTGTSAAARSHSPSSTSQVLRSSCDLSIPLPMVALPWGSRSKRSTRRLVAASDAARLTAVVVLPTPPFCIAMAMTRFMATVYCTVAPMPVDKMRMPQGRVGRALQLLAAQAAKVAPFAAGNEADVRKTARGRFSNRSGHQLARLSCEPLARHLVRDCVRGAILAPGALEDLREAQRNRLYVGDHLRLGGAALVLVRDADDAARIDDIVRRVEDASRGQSAAVLALRELVIGSSCDDARAQAWNGLIVEHTAERARREHIDVESEYFLDRHRPCLEFVADTLHCRLSHIGDDELRA